MKNIVFDLGGVLLEWNIDKILDNAFQSPQVKETVKMATFKHHDWFKLDKGILKYEDAIRDFSKRCILPAVEIKKLLDIAYESLVPIPQSMKLMTDLLEKGFDLYCLSNMHEKAWEMIRKRYDFWDQFKGIVISCVFKNAKPEKEIFEYLLSRFQLDPNETLFIDDHENNIQAAKYLGIRGILFTSPENCRKQIARFITGKPGDE